MPHALLPGLFPWQVEVAKSDARFKVIRCGRRTGKSVLEATEASRYASRGQQVGWLAPSYKKARVGWRIMRWLGKQVGAGVLEGDREIHYPGGGLVQAWTTEDPDSIRSEGYDKVIVDECRDMQARVWYEILRPALLDRGGSASFISTTRGHDWFYDLCQKGERGDAGWATWHFPTHANPIISRSDLDSLDPANGGPDAMPESLWRQEILAEFLEQEGEVFRNVYACAVAEPQNAQPGSQYWTFVDLAQVYDFNAVSTVTSDENRLRQVHVDRWNKSSWDVSEERIVAVGRRYRGHLSIDTTGDSYRDSLVARLRPKLAGYCTVSGIKFTNTNKADMVRNLCAFFEQGHVKILKPDSGAAKVQYDELNSYASDVTRFGNVRYAAPEGKHDDMVTALMASVWMARLRRGSSRETLERLGAI